MNRQLFEWNANTTLMRTNVEENAQIGEMIAAAANASVAPVAVLLPLQGVSMLDSPGGEFWEPQADQACFEAIKIILKPGVPLFELDLNINDLEFARSVAENLLGMLEKIRKVGGGG